MKILITGGAGFIGSNAASRYLRRGDDVVVVDNLSRRGARQNLNWLRAIGRFHFEELDLRDQSAVSNAIEKHRSMGCVLHLAGQVAVTMSVVDPRQDFDINALGTLNVLEAMRECNLDAPLIFASTNKVYGTLSTARTVEEGDRYVLGDLPSGVAESQNLDFHSPYGCSKGAADQYVRDYGRIYGLRTVVLRQSCIYGYRQFGVEDQGWVAWFTIAEQCGLPITVYGDGKQVRDVLFIDDLLDAFDAVIDHIDVAASGVYNIGGGPDNTLSLLDLIRYLEKRSGRRIQTIHEDWRAGDQKIYVSDIRKAWSDLRWAPRVRWEQGLDLLYRWVSDNRALFQ